MLVNNGESSRTTITAVAPVVLDSNDDYIVEAEIRKDKYSNENISALASFGLVVRAPDEGEDGGYGLGHCAAVGIFSCSNASANYVAVLWTADGQASVIKATAFKPGYDWHTYKVEVKGTKIKLFVDGGLMFSGQDNRFLAGGRVGLWSYRTQVSVKSFAVTSNE